MNRFTAALPLAALTLTLPAAALGAGPEPVFLGADGPSVVMPADAPLAIGPLSAHSLAALADLDGDPTVTTADEAAMIEVLMQVLGTPPPVNLEDPG